MRLWKPVMNSKTQITIPTSLLPELEAWGEMTTKLFGQLRHEAGLKPAIIPDDQAWFWTKAWQQGEKEVDEALTTGDYQDFESVNELLQELQSHV